MNPLAILHRGQFPAVNRMYSFAHPLSKEIENGSSVNIHQEVIRYMSGEVRKDRMESLAKLPLFFQTDRLD